MNVYDRLDILRKEIEATKNKLKIRRAIVEDNRARAMQGEDSF
jgi:peptidoglycan hydrolase CwlO-like protein